MSESGFASDDLRVVAARDDAVLIVRCGAKGGRCGKVLAVILDDMTVRHHLAPCHRYDRWLFDQRRIVDAFVAASNQRANAQRARRAFNPPAVVVEPLPRHFRHDPELLTEREWRQFEASGEAPSVE